MDEPGGMWVRVRLGAWGRCEAGGVWAAHNCGNSPSRHPCQSLAGTAAAQKARGRRYMAVVREKAPQSARGKVAFASGTSAATMPAES